MEEIWQFENYMCGNDFNKNWWWNRKKQKDIQKKDCVKSKESQKDRQHVVFLYNYLITNLCSMFQVEKENLICICSLHEPTNTIFIMLNCITDLQL